MTTENFGIGVKLVKEANTSSECPWCNSRKVVKHKRLFKCLECGLEANRDVVGVLNIARLHGDGFNGVLAHPLLLRAEEGAEVKANDALMSVKFQKQESPGFSRGECQSTYYYIFIVLIVIYHIWHVRL